MNTRKAAMEAVERNAEAIRAGRSNWARIADLFVLFLDEHPRSATTKDFVDWLRYEAQDWLDEETSWESFFDISTKGEIKKFISDWVNEKDIQKFMNWLKDEDQDLWNFLNDPEIDEDESFGVWYR